MAIYIYNTLTRKKEELAPIKPDRIGMYVCGPTVYDVPHIGHARSAYTFDVIRRYLEYRGNKVTFVRNVTDVDDKIIEKAKLVHPLTGAGVRQGTIKIAKILGGQKFFLGVSASLRLRSVQAWRLIGLAFRTTRCYTLSK